MQAAAYNAARTVGKNILNNTPALSGLIHQQQTIQQHDHLIQR